MLIDHLKKISPERRSRHYLKMLDARNDAVVASRQRGEFNHIESATLDNWNRMAGIPQWGYTGHERTA
jgi:hypothetical protein